MRNLLLKIKIKLFLLKYQLEAKKTLIQKIRQNNETKYLKDEIKSENINNMLINTTPKKSLGDKYFNSIYSPLREYTYIDSTSFKLENNNIQSPENLRVCSPMNCIINIKIFLSKINPDISAKKIDFNSDSIDKLKLNF